MASREQRRSTSLDGSYVPAAPDMRNAGRIAFRVSRHIVAEPIHSGRGFLIRIVVSGSTFRFIAGMIRLFRPGSKLCAYSTRPKNLLFANFFNLARKGKPFRCIHPFVRRFAAGGTRPRFHTSEVRG
jgi:hypothetical protein